MPGYGAATWAYEPPDWWRTAVAALIIGEHAHCAHVLAPSVTIKRGAGGGMIAANVLHDQSIRWPDRMAGFPAATMPSLPLAWAAGGSGGCHRLRMAGDKRPPWEHTVCWCWAGT